MKGLQKFMTLYSNGIVFVKEYDFFITQGGHVADWGRRWRLIEASSVEHAREIATYLELTRQ